MNIDKNTIFGFVLIFVILIGFSYINQPSEEQIAAAKQEQAEQTRAEIAKQNQAEQKVIEESPINSSNDSIRTAAAQSEYGIFSSAVSGEKRLITLENNLIKVTFVNRGGRIFSVEQKNYKRHDGSPLIQFVGDDNKFGASFFSNNRSIDTDNLIFTPSGDIDKVIGGGEVPKGKEGDEEYNSENSVQKGAINMTLRTTSGEVLEYQYSLKHNSYVVDFNIVSKGFDKILGDKAGSLDFVWDVTIPRQEKKSSFGEERYTTVLYKLDGSTDVEDLSVSGDDQESVITPVEWIAYKQLFFTSALIAPEGIAAADINVKQFEDDPTYLSKFSTKLTLPVGAKSSEVIPMNFYFGPNKYTTLEQYDRNMEDLIQLGWGVFGWVNKYIVIPAFNFLSKFISNYGLIIFLLTIYIKLLVLPFTYKSFQSQAKMRVLKPEIDAIKEKVGDKDPMKLQKKTMELYKKVGVSPLGGCVPMLFQMPILFAMFRFFPVSIELRQQPFLWATDLSSYDSIAELPFTIPFYGDHVSLFCLLMTVVNFFYMKSNSSDMAGASQQMPGMKIMMTYMMPIMLLVFFNNYAAGLSYYYFVATLFTVCQTIFFKKMTDEDKILAQMNEKKKRPVKRSKFQQRLEDMAKQQEQAKAAKKK